MVCNFGVTLTCRVKHLPVQKIIWVNLGIRTAWSIFPINCPVLQESQVCMENWPWKGWISRVHWREIIHKFCSWSAYRELACDADVLAGAPTFQPTQNLKITTKHLQWQAHLHWHTRIYGFKRSDSKSTGREVQILRRTWNHQTGYQEWQNLVQGSPQLGTTAVRIKLVTALQNMCYENQH